MSAQSLKYLQQIWQSHQQKGRFLLVGAAVFVADAAMFYLFFELFHLQVLAARVAAFSIAVLLSWWCNRCWTFHERKQAAKTKQLLMFITVSSVAAIANLSAFYLVTLLLGKTWLDLSLAFSVGVLVGLMLNWFGANLWTFKVVKDE
ncbi:GtrA family protein [Shewanella kaireitica]|uniref:GtrA family protein n=1 Tax=Shewanella kaireitica TaxID=212021 RepID=UPI00200FF2FA|nr:GtrA family protein [Shewanella kaireitica]MCL1093090.1 GtrA family protein [Shewanella kaireitica]